MINYSLSSNAFRLISSQILSCINTSCGYSTRSPSNLNGKLPTLLRRSLSALLCSLLNLFTTPFPSPLLNHHTLQLPLGMGGACSTRIGQHLGANRPLEAKAATRVALLTASRLARSRCVPRCHIDSSISHDKRFIECIHLFYKAK